MASVLVAPPTHTKLVAVVEVTRTAPGVADRGWGWLDQLGGLTPFTLPQPLNHMYNNVTANRVKYTKKSTTGSITRFVRCINCGYYSRSVYVYTVKPPTKVTSGLDVT